MKYNSSENPIEKIEFIIKNLIDFSNKNEFDFSLYKGFAEESSKAFNRYFSQIEDKTAKEIIISNLKTDFYFSIDDMAINLLSKKDTKRDNFEEGVTYYISTPIEDTRIRDYKNNYHQLIELFLNSVQFETSISLIPDLEALDLSNTSAVEKIIYLNELGIIDFLRKKPEFINSTNLMATFLSAVTGEKTTTLQTSLNRLISDDTSDKNHPYKSIKTVEKVRQTLIDKNIKPKTS